MPTKKANAYLCIKTDKLRFLDIKNYLAPDFSYAKFFKTYGSEEQKTYGSIVWRNWTTDCRHMVLIGYNPLNGK